MRYAQSPVRPGLTAIAAVLALSSTPSFAQEATPVTVTPPPVETTAPASTPAATVTPAPTVATPAPVASVTVQSSAPAASAANGSLVTVPIRPGGIAPGLNAAPSTPTAPAPEVETAETAAAPVARTASTPRSAPVRETAPTVPVAERAAPAALSAPPATQAPAVEPAAPPAETTAVAPAPAPAPRTAQADASNDVLPIAGAAGAAILLLGGGLFAMRRRRRDEDEVYVADRGATPIDPVEPVATFEQPAYAAPLASPVGAMPVARADTIDAPSTAIPAGFDTSRFGRHTQAAYRGPTPENPFLSLKRRLKRASFMDQRERMASEGAIPTPQAASAPSPQPAQAPRQTEHITTRIKTPPRPGFRPAWQG